MESGYYYFFNIINLYVVCTVIFEINYIVPLFNCYIVKKQQSSNEAMKQ